MKWIKHRYKKHKRKTNELAKLRKENKELKAKLAKVEGLFEVVTLEDLQLTIEEQATLRSCDKVYRNALWKSGEHICLTVVPECCRKTAISYRDYMRRLTLTDKNRISEIDDTPQDKAEQRTKKFFTPRV